MKWEALFTLNHYEQIEADTYGAAVKEALDRLKELQDKETENRKWVIELVAHNTTIDTT